MMFLELFMMIGVQILCIKCDRCSDVNYPDDAVWSQ